MAEYHYNLDPVNTTQLKKEIEASTVTIALDYINAADGTVDIVFKATLSAGEVTTLDGLVAAHVAGLTVAEKNPVLVHEINTETGNPEPVQFTFSEGRSRVLASSKPIIPGKILYFYWAGISDDVTDPNNCIIGNGKNIRIDLEPTDSRKSIKLYYGNYNCNELVYLAGGAFQWSGTDWGDWISLAVMADPTPTQQAANLDYELDGERIKIAAGGPGTGTHGLAGTPVFVPNYNKMGYWNLTPQFTAEPAAETGAYDWYTVEKEAGQFVEKLPLFGTETKGLQLMSPEVSNLPAGYFLKVTCKNNSGGTWQLSGSLMFFREKVGNP